MVITKTNPIKEFREKNELTQNELANSLGITRQVITNLERGLLSHLPTELSQYTSISPTQYTDWVTTQRHENSPYFHTPELNHFYSSELPLNYRTNKDRWLSFKYLVRPDRSHRGFCRLLVYQPSLLALYESKNQCKPSLIAALRQVLLSDHEISQTGIVIPS
jgi:transcriptional regulator with XRE-family HTH domain